MFGFDKLTLLNGLEDGFLEVRGLELLVTLIFGGLFEEEDAVGLDEEVHEFPLFL